MRPLLFACVLSFAAMPALARTPASVNFGNRKLQCRAMTCACGVCSQCRTQGEREACEKRMKEPEVADTGEHGAYFTNDDNDLVTEDKD